ncbi:class I SAM-dependent methyltransferase [Algibacter sp. AS12]|uniref:class I SAM-dependent methyltransferase n=1 Tax=Algibacter sp. AS12 TaxID=3135773 RepID=UPI00398ACE6F
MNDFINIPFSKKNIDSYYIRFSIFKALKNILPKFNGRLLDIGCGKMPYKEYILGHSEVTEYVGLDIEQALVYDIKVKPDFTWDGIKMPFKNNSFSCAFGTEVLEHCPEPEVVLKEVYRILKPGGTFFFTVPFLWNLHEVPHDEYRYTPFSLKRHLENSGFQKIEIKATGGWHASMAQMLGLWVKRSPMSKTKRKWLLYAIKPIINYLIKLDKPESVTFKEGQMITGLYGTARK